MRDLRGQFGAAGDSNQFLKRFFRLVAFVAHMADVQAAMPSRDFRTGNKFVRRGVKPRIVFQPRRQSQAARFHFLRNKRAHLFQFAARDRALVIGSRRRAAHRAMPDETGDVERNVFGFQLREPVFEGQMRTSVLPDNGCGNALPNVGFRVGVFQ